MDDLEHQLRRYRPVGPPAELRARVVAAGRTGAPRRWAWVPSAAAMAAAFLFYVLAASARRDLTAELTKADRYRDVIVRALAADLGGGEEASHVAARLIELNEAADAAAGERGTALNVEDSRRD